MKAAAVYARDATTIRAVKAAHPSKAQAALALLADADQGITEALLAANGVKRATLDKLVAAGKVRTTESTLVSPPGLKVTRYHLVRKENG